MLKQKKLIQNFVRSYAKKNKKGGNEELAEVVFDTKDLSPKMEKQIEFYKNNLKTMSFGRVTTQQLENIKIKISKNESHPLISLASIIAKSPRQIIISTFDKNILQVVLKTLKEADLGFNPEIEGSQINIPVHPMTKEIRENGVKLAKKISDKAKDGIRNVRHEGQSKLKNLKKVLPKDEFFEKEKELEKLTKLYVDKVDDLLKMKEKEIMKI
eukprot:gene4147-7457_t